MGASWRSEGQGMAQRKLKYCANLGWLFADLPFEQRFAAAAKAGFRGVEFSQPYDYPIATLKGLLRENDLELVLFNLPAGNWAGGDRGIGCIRARQQEFADGLKRALDYAVELGCKRVNCLSGIMPQGVDEGGLWQTLAENLHLAAEALARENILLVTEPINRNDFAGFFLNTSARGMKAIAMAAHPNIKLQYDIYHMQRSEGELAATIARLLPMIGHMQVADNPGRHQPGTGEINFSFLLNHIAALGYDGWMGCEYAPRGKTQDTLGWMI
jgi:hydroxypyruvate isomerase